MVKPTYEQRRMSFGSAARDYAQFRPGYPPAAVDWVLAAGVGHINRVVDVGAGTGALTAELVGRSLDVDAIEPDAAMLTELGERVSQARRHVASAEDIPLPAACADALVVAQAWHWMNAHTAAREFARVVRPGGALGVVWNVRLLECDWMRELGALIGGEDSMQAAVRVRIESHDDDAIVLGEHWSLPERGEFRHHVEMTADSLVRLVDTYSYVRLRDDRDEVLAQVHRIATEHPDLAGHATFAMPYVTVAYRATRVS